MSRRLCTLVLIAATLVLPACQDGGASAPPDVIGGIDGAVLDVSMRWPTVSVEIVPSGASADTVFVDVVAPANKVIVLRANDEDRTVLKRLDTPDPYRLTVTRSGRTVTFSDADGLSEAATSRDVTTRDPSLFTRTSLAEPVDDHRTQRIEVALHEWAFDLLVYSES